MKIEKKTVEHIAKLSRLSFDEREKEMFSSQLSGILEHVEKISALDLEGVEPTSHAVRLRNVLRADEERPSLDQETALSNAPESERHQFKVPRIV